MMALRFVEEPFFWGVERAIVARVAVVARSCRRGYCAFTTSSRSLVVKSSVPPTRSPVIASSLLLRPSASGHQSRDTQLAIATSLSAALALGPGIRPVDRDVAWTPGGRSGRRTQRTHHGHHPRIDTDANAAPA